MRRYWIDLADKSGDRVVFRGDVFHHVFDVCRQQQGSKFEVLTEEGKAYFVEVTAVGKRDAEARVLEERRIAPLKEPFIHLNLCVPRFPVMDAVVEKAVEMGVHRLQPLFSDYSFVRGEGSLSANKLERWDKIVKSATQQSGRGDLMKLASPMMLEKWLAGFNRSPQVAGLFAYEGPSTLGVKEYLKELRGQGVPREIHLIVGAEGGFSTAEVQALENQGLRPVTLGAQVLRVETACIALIAALKYDFDLMC